MGRKNNLEIEKLKAFIRLKKSLTLSNLWIYILSLAKKKKIYAYTLAKEIEKNFSFKPSLLWIYLVLYKLNSEGFLLSKVKNNRKYYYITKKGLAALAHAKNFIKEVYNKL
ncbi:MAG: PadR family transcriptional regulator [Candidatus Anstonellaceae archaeon]